MSDTFLVGDVEVKVDSATVTIGYNDYPVRNIQMVKLIPYNPSSKIRTFSILFYGMVIFAIWKIFAGLLHPAGLKFGHFMFFVWPVISAVFAISTFINAAHIITFDNSLAGTALAQRIWTFGDILVGLLFFNLSQSKYDDSFHNIKLVADRIKQAVHELQHTN